MTPDLEYSLIQDGLGFQHPDIRELCISRPFHGEWENLIAVTLNLRLPPMYPNVDTIVDPVSEDQSCASPKNPTPDTVQWAFKTTGAWPVLSRNLVFLDGWAGGYVPESRCWLGIADLLGWLG